MLTPTFALVAIAALVAGAAIQLILALAGYRAQRTARATQRSVASLIPRC